MEELQSRYLKLFVKYYINSLQLKANLPHYWCFIKNDSLKVPESTLYTNRQKLNKSASERIIPPTPFRPIKHNLFNPNELMFFSSCVLFWCGMMLIFYSNWQTAFSKHVSSNMQPRTLGVVWSNGMIFIFFLHSPHSSMAFGSTLEGKKTNNNS